MEVCGIDVMVMATGRKIDISDYEFEIFHDQGGARSKKADTMQVKMVLPDYLCNPNLSPEPGKPDPKFDLYKIGKVSRMIEHAAGDYVVLVESDYEVLKARVNVLCRFLGKPFYEFVERVMEAPTVELEEKRA